MGKTVFCSQVVGIHPSRPACSEYSRVLLHWVLTEGVMEGCGTPTILPNQVMK